jgi:hypothetical protein
MTVVIDGGAGVTFPDTVQQTNAVTNTGGDPRYYAARAWVNFDGVGAVTIRAAVNVSSITDNGTGDFSVNFTMPMPDANYSVSGLCARNTSGDPLYLALYPSATYANTLSPTRFRIDTGLPSGTNEDPNTVTLVVFR